MKLKRMHPFKIVQSFFLTLKSSAIIIFYLFIISFNDRSFIPTYGRIAFFIFLIYQLIAIIVQWRNTTYEIKNNHIHMYRGVFKKRHNRVSLATVQNVQRTTPIYFRPFSVTSLHLETSATDRRASITFEAITVDEASKIEKELEQVRAREESIRERTDKSEQIADDQARTDPPEYQSKEQAVGVTSERTVHFQPTREELLKASFLSLSFLVVIPVVISFYENVEDFIFLEDTAMNVFQTIKGSWLFIGLTVGLLATTLVGSGVAWTFLKYGKYKIASDHDHIYVQMGTLSERSFSIQKSNVQAIHVIQNPLKKWLGLCEVKLVSAESIEDEASDISTLYPYMEKERAFHMIKELLLEFPIVTKGNPLPKKSLMMKMIRIPWFFIFISVIVLTILRSLWFVLPILLVTTYLERYLVYRNTRYIIKNGHIQFIKGGLWSSLFVTNRKRVIEIEVTRSFGQQKLGLATISTVNQTKPSYQIDLEDIPVDVAKDFVQWYGSRYEEIQLK